MQRNFDYITKKDLIIEHNGMNAEDKPEYSNYIEPHVTVPPPPFQKGSQILQFHSSSPVFDNDGFIGLGKRNQGIRLPLEAKAYSQKYKIGIGFIYVKGERYPNRRRHFIQWMLGSAFVGTVSKSNKPYKSILR
jgi:hypothetical protein